MASPAASSPAAAALASMKQLVLLRLHSSVLALLFAAVFYGIAISLAASYFRRSAGQRSEPVFVRVYVLAIVAGGTAYLAIQATMLYQLLTALSTGVPPLPGARPTVAQTLETWVVFLFALTVESYYVYRAVRVTHNRFLQALAILLELGALSGFLGFAVTNTRIRFGAVVPPRQVLTYIFAATWAFTTDGLLCASILLYELVYKRRSSVVRSSVVQQFTVVAVRSSGLVALLLVSTATMGTIGYVSQDPVYIQTGFATSRIFPFVSCCIVLTSLHHLHYLRLRDDESDFHTPQHRRSAPPAKSSVGEGGVCRSDRTRRRKRGG
ncbi:RHTO0S03e11606g1_1 [Rhodotorula toruloides]|uniref:RHTO0S03e11606g1_1 n=2 Tax=Rhodotorula toruloides TaxID=5286 RepID=A0A061AV71_RHOTO|nr:uncharacterized protein RHTO_00547 [Rhodotorula toruloides NP11]EMS26119.1 hypothetical protein RHTO_00547 [Rhodotorula toruloides NP11]CDR38635.1 RHTO0S03e11606g1_1 [Rhodotorula toruloides]